MTTYLLRQPADLHCQAIDTLAVWIPTLAKNLLLPTLELHQHSLTKTEAALSQKIEIIRNHFNCQIPKGFYNTLLDKTIKELHLLVQKTEQEYLSYKCVSQTNVIKRIIESLFTKKATSLSLNRNEFAMFQDSLLSKSYMLTDLIRLDLNFEMLSKSNCNTARRWTDADVIPLLEDLHSLKYLTINYICTDDILRCLVDKCKLIEELNISSSTQISDDSIVLLTQLHYLRTIDMRNTSIYWTGIEKLLLCCKNIENIMVNPSRVNGNKMPRVLKQIDQSIEKFPKLFKITTYRSVNETFEELEVLVQMCPLIRHLSVCIDYKIQSDYNLLAITSLQHLRELTLEGYGFYIDHVKEALAAVGSNLEHLHLHRVMEIDLDALINISQMCPSLKTLSLDDCHSIYNTPLQHNLKTKYKRTDKTKDTTYNIIQLRPNELRLGPFRKLKKIILTTSHRVEYQLLHDLALFLLSNCLNVEFIQLSRSVWLTEDLLLQVLDKNPLIYLKELKICENQHLPSISMEETITSSVMDRIIQNCISRPQVIVVKEN